MTVIETTATQLPAPGTWRIDPAHSAVAFSVRHLGVAKTRGRFGAFEGAVHVADDPKASSVEVTIDAASIDTHEARRDEHLRSADFLDVERHPSLTFRSTSVEGDGDRWAVDGELTILGVTRPVRLDVTYEGSTRDPWGGQRAAFSAHTEIDRESFGLTWNQALEAGGLLVGRNVKIELDVELVREES
jgi:polyisoprenoid-binding protein YceI